MTDFDTAIASVCKAAKVKRSAMISSSREWPNVEARHLLVLLLSRKQFKDGIIADIICRKRVTVVKSRQTANLLLSTSSVFRSKFDKAQSIYEETIKSLRLANG